MKKRCISFLLVLLCGCLPVKEDFTSRDKDTDSFFPIFTRSNTTLFEIIEAVREYNDAYPFVDNFIQIYGSPIWDEALCIQIDACEVYAVPIKHPQKEEIESIWFLSKQPDGIHFFVFARTERPTDMKEQDWMFDYFTQNVLKISPKSGLFFPPKQQITKGLIDVEYCNDVYSSAGGQTYYQGRHCWHEFIYIASRFEEGSTGSGGGGGSGGSLSGYIPQNRGEVASAKVVTLEEKLVSYTKNLTDKQVLKLENALAEMLNVCGLNTLNQYLVERGRKLSSIVFIKPLDWQEGQEAEFNAKYSGLNFYEENNITMGTLAHEYIHFFQAFFNNWNLPNELRGKLEVERHILLDIIYEVDLRERDPVLFANRGQTRLFNGINTNNLETEYNKWLFKITDNFSKIPQNIDVNKVAYWAVEYGKYTINPEYGKYDYTVNYNFVINSMLEIVSNSNCYK